MDFLLLVAGVVIDSFGKLLTLGIYFLKNIDSYLGYIKQTLFGIHHFRGERKILKQINWGAVLLQSVKLK